MASRSGSDPSEKEATGHFLSTLSFCKITSKEYLCWIDFPSLHASKNLLNLREMEKKPALLHFNGQLCSNKPKCLMTSPVPHLPRGHNHPHTWRPEAFWAADSRQSSLTQWFSTWLHLDRLPYLPLRLQGLLLPWRPSGLASRDFLGHLPQLSPTVLRFFPCLP